MLDLPVGWLQAQCSEGAGTGFLPSAILSRKELLKKIFSNYDQLPEEIRLALPLKRVWMVAEPDDT
jgi:predicted Mrr-cat superfamily restriction endonuclease